MIKRGQQMNVGSPDFPIRPVPPVVPPPRPSREQREKAALQQRMSGFQRYTQEIEAPFTILPGTSFYQDDTQRLHGNIIMDQHQQRALQAQHYTQELQQRRQRALDREQQRCMEMDRVFQQQQNKVLSLQQSATKAKKNEGSMPLNTITLAYAETQSGVALQYNDHVVRYRAALRSQHLDSKNNGEYNPITHQPRPRVPEPSKPHMPHFQPQQQQHEEQKEQQLT